MNRAGTDRVIVTTFPPLRFFCLRTSLSILLDVFPAATGHLRLRERAILSFSKAVAVSLCLVVHHFLSYLLLKASQYGSAAQSYQ